MLFYFFYISFYIKHTGKKNCELPLIYEMCYINELVGKHKEWHHPQCFMSGGSLSGTMSSVVKLTVTWASTEARTID